MTKNTHLDAFFTEAATTDKYGDNAIRAGIVAFVPHANNAIEQATSLARSLQLAELTETRETVRGKFEETMQNVRAVARIATEIQRQLKELVDASRGVARMVAELKALHETVD